MFQVKENHLRSIVKLTTLEKMSLCHGTLVKIIVLITILFCYRYNCYEISSKDPQLRLPSLQFDSSPRDQINYHHYRRSDQHEPYNPQQRQIALNAIPKSQKYEGWKPIVSSRRLQTPREKYSQYSSSTVVESSSVTSHTNAITDTTTEQPSKVTIPQPQQPKYKTVKEDDIMWMHYGADDEDDYKKEKLPSASEEKPKNNVNEATVASKQQFQFHSQYALDDSTRKNPKNIHEIMQANSGNSPPTFKPIAQNTPQMSSVIFFGIDNKSRTEVEKGSEKNNVYGGRPNEQVVKVDPSHEPATGSERRYYTQTDSKNTLEQMEPTEETSVENDSDSGSWLSSYFGKQSLTEKGGKFLGKPIVITEQAEPLPYFTAEYYRKLFDSFGRQDRSFDNKLSNQTDSTTNTTTDNRTDIKSDQASANCTSNQTTCNKISFKHENRPSHRHRHRHRFNIFKVMGIDMNDLMPKTLRSNIYLIKKLLAQCYTELQDEDPSPIVCLKKITTKVLDNAIGKDIIKLTDNVSLVKENVTDIAEYERYAFIYTYDLHLRANDQNEKIFLK